MKNYLFQPDGDLGVMIIKLHTNRKVANLLRITGIIAKKKYTDRNFHYKNKCPKQGEVDFQKRFKLNYTSLWGENRSYISEMFISEEEIGTVKDFRKSVIEREKIFLRVNKTYNEDKGHLKQDLQQSEFG